MFKVNQRASSQYSWTQYLIFRKTNTLKLPVARCTDDSIMEKCIAREPPVPAMMMRKIMMMINTMKIDDHDDHDEKDNAENSSCQLQSTKDKNKDT